MMSSEAMMVKVDADSATSLRMDIATARVLVWISTAGRDATLTPDAHAFFADRYHRLAECHRRRGNDVRARELQARADEHAELGGWTGPPYAAAMAMPRPRRWTVTNAVSRSGMGGSDHAA
jgi:hypothetical protein